MNRAELIEASQLFGKSLKTASKDSTKRLEEYITNKLGGRGTKVPTFTEQQKRDVRSAADTYGLSDALHLTAYRIWKTTGEQDELNYLRVTIARSFEPYFEGGVRKEHVDELMRRLPALERNELISGVSNLAPYYSQLFEDYAEELNP